jgi:hypothetical protein
MWWLFLLFLAAVMSGGCASDRRAGSQKPVEAIVTPAAGTRGQVISVNVRGRFVVLSYPVGVLPSVDRRLNVYRSGLKVAELKVTGPNRDTLTVADLVAGECQIGDEARED